MEDSIPENFDIESMQTKAADIFDCLKTPNPKGTNGKRGEFIRGPIPIDWLAKAAAISSGAFHLGVILWHLERMRGAPVVMTPTKYKRYGLPQRTVHRLLRTMTAAGLTTLELGERRSARVTVIKEPQQPLETVQ